MFIFRIISDRYNKKLYSGAIEMGAHLLYLKGKYVIIMTALFNERPATGKKLK